MPLSEPAARKHLHTRQVTFTGFEREDGMFDIEGHLVDTKTYDVENKDRNGIPKGEPVHNMYVRLTVDDKFVVRAIEAVIEDSPFNICPTIEPAFQVLVGEVVAAGWNRRVRAKLGGTKGCTHLVEMMAPLATATFQTVYPALERRRADDGKRADKPSILDGCHAMDVTGPLVKDRWPDFYEGKD